MLHINEEQLSLYMSLFRGRNDIYARRWEKYGKHGAGAIRYVELIIAILLAPTAALSAVRGSGALIAGLSTSLG